MIDKRAAALAEFKESIPIFDCLANETRQQIILLLGSQSGGLNVSELTVQVGLSRPAVSHHLKLLRQVGLVDFHKQGKENHYYLTLQAGLNQLKDLIRLIEASCFQTK